jgi:hypothetical protein
MEFFAPNMTAFIQPLDAGIICCFKAHYCALFCQCTLDLDTIGEENIFKINICKAMLMAKEAWDAVQPMTIKCCWDQPYRHPAWSYHAMNSSKAWSQAWDQPSLVGSLEHP